MGRAAIDFLLGTLTYSASVSSTSSWLTIVSGDTGVNGGTINVSYAANSGAQRTGAIVVTASGASGSPMTLAITQAAVGTQPLIFGFDISGFQYGNLIDWTSVASSQIFDSYSGQNYPLSFVILRASKGTIAGVDNCQFQDSKFTDRAPAAKSAGLAVGAYHAAAVHNDSTGENYSPASEAAFFVSVAGDSIKAGNLRPFLDVEDHSCASLSSYVGLASWVDQWMQEVQRLTGVTPIIYTTRWFANDSRNSNNLLSLASKYELWIANYAATANDAPTDPSATQVVPPWNINLLLRRVA